MSWINFYLLYLDQISTGFGLLGALSYLIRQNFSGIQMKGIFINIFSLGLIPVGIGFIICAFDPQLLNSLKSANIYIAAAGCGIIYVAWDAVSQKE